MIRSREVWFVCGFFVAFVLFAGSATAITLPELASRVENMNRSEREALLIKGAKEEKEVMFYGTTPVNQVAVLKKAFSARYPFVDLKHFYSPRQGILNKTVSEFRGGANLADVIMTDVSYGYQLIKEGISNPFSTTYWKSCVWGPYGPTGNWHTLSMS